MFLKASVLLFSFLFTFPFKKAQNEIVISKLGIEVPYSMVGSSIYMNEEIGALAYNDTFFLKTDKEIFYYRVLGREEFPMISLKENEILLCNSDTYYRAVLTGKLVKK